jgi:hypothetical protein
MPLWTVVRREGAEMKMSRFRTYWAYSIGLAIVWVIVLTLTLMIKGAEGLLPLLLVFLGFCLGWVSTTIARYLYPPPARWTANRPQA